MESRPTFALVCQEHGRREVLGWVQDDVLGGLQVLHEVDKVVAGHPTVSVARAVHHRRGAVCVCVCVGGGGGGGRHIVLCYELWRKNNPRALCRSMV